MEDPTIYRPISWRNGEETCLIDGRWAFRQRSGLPWHWASPAVAEASQKHFTFLKTLYPKHESKTT